MFWQGGPVVSGSRPPLATAIQSAMDAKGWNQRETSESSGVSIRTLQRMLNPKPQADLKPWRSTLGKLALALEAPGLVDYSVRPTPEEIEDRLSEVEEGLRRLQEAVLRHLDGDQQPS